VAGSRIVTGRSRLYRQDQPKTPPSTYGILVGSSSPLPLPDAAVQPRRRGGEGVGVAFTLIANPAFKEMEPGRITGLLSVRPSTNTEAARRVLSSGGEFNRRRQMPRQTVDDMGSTLWTTRKHSR
jgi:hypothetical protein